MVFKLTQEEIHSFIHGLADQSTTDYQASAFLMATFFQGMDFQETAWLTEAMLQSGERYSFPEISEPLIDKHSTGGIGDKVSLILAPLAVACGLKVPMMSGRGLGLTGGTLDKLESIPGFQVNLTYEKFKQTLMKVGCAMTGQTPTIAPADKKLYAIRDVTATVECIPLITASILSKKLAEGAQGLVLDVKVGSGAFMKTPAQAKKLAQTIMKVAHQMKLPCKAIITSMNEPLGYAIGNAIEVQECIQILKNELQEPKLSEDLIQITLQLCAEMILLGKKAKTFTQAKHLATEKLTDGSAWKIFKELVNDQGGNLYSIQKPENLKLAPSTTTWTSHHSGFFSSLKADTLGLILLELGGGRKKVSDNIDHSVGLKIHRKLGDAVKKGDPLLTLYTHPQQDLALLEILFRNSFKISKKRKSIMLG